LDDQKNTIQSLNFIICVTECAKECLIWKERILEVIIRGIAAFMVLMLLGFNGAYADEFSCLVAVV
jgi:hypothetical protein